MKKYLFLEVLNLILLYLLLTVPYMIHQQGIYPPTVIEDLGGILFVILCFTGLVILPALILLKFKDKVAPQVQLAPKPLLSQRQSYLLYGGILAYNLVSLFFYPDRNQMLIFAASIAVSIVIYIIQRIKTKR